MIYLETAAIKDLHARVVELSGGSKAVRDANLLESAAAQPKMTFAGQFVYPTLAEKAAALGFSLIRTGPFAHGNERTGHAAMETFLALNGYAIDAPLDDQEKVILTVAAGVLERDAFVDWLKKHIARIQST
jgi:death-on-curing protein